MKKSLLILFVALISCGQSLSIDSLKRSAGMKTEKQKKAEQAQLIVDIGLLSGVAMLDYSVPCYTLQDNPIYFSPGYFPSFNLFSQRSVIIIGDSTQDFSREFPGYTDESISANYAVAGNTLCDMTRQWFSIRQDNPSVVMVATSGGNDLLRQYPDSEIISNGIGLIDKIHLRWPGAKIVFLAVHPTLVSWANTHKANTNSGIKNYLLSYVNTCWYDPLPLFGVAEGQPAPSGKLVDAVHWTQATAMQIKNGLQTSCGYVY